MGSGRPLYRIILQSSHIALETFVRDDGPFRWKRIELGSFKDEIAGCDYQSSEATILGVSVLQLILNNGKAEKFFTLAGETKSCNITFNPEVPLKLLRGIFDIRYIRNEAHKPRLEMDRDRLNALCHEAYNPVREKLGWGEPKDTSVCYRITNDVIEAAVSLEFKDYLDRVALHFPFIYPAQLDKVSAEICELFPQNADPVIKLLKKTKGRGHLASISLTEVYGELMVCLANHHKQRLRVEAWKFALLLESPNEPRMLARLERLDYREKRTPFLFNDLTSGDVQAMFYPDTSTIRVVCQREEDKLPAEQASFVVDPEYLLSLYLLLSRLREDKAEFSRLWEEATVTPTQNIFDSLYIHD